MNSLSNSVFGLGGGNYFYLLSGVTSGSGLLDGNIPYFFCSL
jgi:hypothetical protein